MKGINNKKYLKFILILFASFFVVGSLLLTKSLAQTPTPTPAEEEEEISPEIKEKVQERIEAIKESGSRKGAFFGNLTDISNSTLILEYQEKEEIVKTDDETTFIGKSNQAIEINDLEIEDFIIAMGYLEEDILTGKRISVLAEEPEPTEVREAVYGTIADLSQEEEIISLNTLKEEVTYEIEVTAKTEINQKIDEETEEIGFKDLEIGDRLVVVGTLENENKTIAATLIRLLSAETEEEIIPTPKASPTPEEEE